MVRKSHDVRGLALPQQLDYHRDPKAGPPCLAVLEALPEASSRRLKDYDRFRPCSGRR